MVVLLDGLAEWFCLVVFSFVVGIRFKDPTNTTVGVGKYLAAIGILFDPRYSKHELLTIETTTADGAPAIKATWKLGG